MMEYLLRCEGHGDTVFVEDGGFVQLARLFGIPMSEDKQGMAVVNAAAGRFVGRDFSDYECVAEDGVIRVSWLLADGDMKYDSVWSQCADTGVISRRDTLTNTGDADVIVTRCLARFSLLPAMYELYSQDSRWCGESQGRWQELTDVTALLRCESGRTTQGGTPYACIREVDRSEGLVFHVVPQGNWLIRASTQAVLSRSRYAVVEAGMSDENMRLLLRPGESFEAPEILLQELRGEPEGSAPELQEYVLANFPCAVPKESPVVWNTWFDDSEHLDLARLRRQLSTVSGLGCEVLVIDAGWYGQGEGSWASQTGDWREKLDGAFEGEMMSFADEVRAEGLGFGLWMEPERFCAGVPIRSEHPDWFIGPEDGAARLDIEKPEAYEYQKSEISRLVETYKLAWMKVDFNFILDYDQSGSELSGYYAAAYRLFDEVQRDHPETFFEGCSSGGMRLDINALSHFDSHFLSDTVNPIDVLRISQGTLLRIPPGRIAKWAVMRGVLGNIPTYGSGPTGSSPIVMVPSGALWDRPVRCSVDFACLVAMTGMLGISGDPSSLPEDDLTRMGEHIAFFKEWREFIAGSTASLLTTPLLIEDRFGWVAFQFQNADSDAKLVFAFRLEDHRWTNSFKLSGLESQTTYSVTFHGSSDDPGREYTGAELATSGLRVDLPTSESAVVCVVRPI